MDVCLFECCVLSGRGLCDELITRPEGTYRQWCVIVGDQNNLGNEEAMARVGPCAKRNINLPTEDAAAHQLKMLQHTN